MILDPIISFIKALINSMKGTGPVLPIKTVTVVVPNDDSYLSKDDLAKLAKLQPLMADKLKRTIITAKKEKLNVGLFSGHRTFEEQRLQYAKGRDLNGNIINKLEIVTRSKPGFSWHNYALAGDLVFKTDKGLWTWSAKMNWQRLGEIGESYDLTWGGRWTDPVDTPHFQYTKGISSVETAFHIYTTDGLPGVWQRLI